MNIMDTLPRKGSFRHLTMQQLISSQTGLAVQEAGFFFTKTQNYFQDIRNSAKNGLLNFL